MTTTTDLSPERLDELERDAVWALPRHVDLQMDGDTLRALIAMARAKQAAERERDEWRGLLADAYSDREAVRDPDDQCYWCFGGAPRAYEMNPASLPHVDDCLGERIRIALAQPTTEGGE